MAPPGNGRAEAFAAGRNNEGIRPVSAGPIWIGFSGVGGSWLAEPRLWQDAEFLPHTRAGQGGRQPQAVSGHAPSPQGGQYHEGNGLTARELLNGPRRMP